MNFDQITELTEAQYQGLKQIDLLDQPSPCWQEFSIVVQSGQAKEQSLYALHFQALTWLMEKLMNGVPRMIQMSHSRTKLEATEVVRLLVIAAYTSVEDTEFPGDLLYLPLNLNYGETMFELVELSVANDEGREDVQFERLPSFPSLFRRTGY